MRIGGVIFHSLYTFIPSPVLLMRTVTDKKRKKTVVINVFIFTKTYDKL